MNVTSTKASFKMDFSLLFVSQKGGVMSSRPRLGHFFPSSSVFHAVAEWQILKIENRARFVWKPAVHSLKMCSV